ncbi:MAG: T9SS type A sorting domain-containing protein, partial [Paludibacter sp.]
TNGCITGITSSSFKDATNNDWSLASGSAAINAGTDLSTATSPVTSDIAGNNRPTGSNKVDMGAYEYISYRSNATGNWGDYTIWQLSADGTTFSALPSATYVPSSSMAGSVSILNGHTVTVATNASSRTLTVNAGGKLTLNSGFTLGVNGNFTINSDATNGTGTFVDANANGGLTVSGTSSVQQYLSSSRNWYMSSPVSGASSLPTVSTGTLTFYSYPESDINQSTGANGYAAGAFWNTVSTGTMSVGTGYIIKPSTTSTVTFSGTGLNTGSQTISGLTYSSANPKHGFNLIGNPYPSYLNVLPSISANSDGIEPTVWYRTRDVAGYYHCETVNSTDGFGTNSSLTGRVTGYIPPMQGFWVRTKLNNQSIALSNSNRSHTTTVTQPGVGSVPTTPLKAPTLKNETYGLLGLNVFNGITGDETIIKFYSGATNNLDPYDSGKMSNGNVNIPELFTVVEGSQLAINTMNSIPYDTEIALGFTTGKSGDFTINTSLMSNFSEGTQILLKDNIDPLNPVITDLTTQSYSFNSDTTTSNATRFTLIFKAPSVATEINDTENKENVWISTRNGQIEVNGNTNNKTMLEVFNALGQKVISKNLTGTNAQLKNSLATGAYLVKLTTEGKSITRKIIID